jgi:hypothetical protein
MRLVPEVPESAVRLVVGAALAADAAPRILCLTGGRGAGQSRIKGGRVPMRGGARTRQRRPRRLTGRPARVSTCG